MNRFTCTMLCLSAAFLLSACGDDDNPVDGDHDEHAEAFGVVVLDSGAEIARDEAGTVTGEIEVGVERETALLSVRFLAEDGDLFTPDDDDETLGWEIADTSIADVEHHEEDGAWRFHVAGHVAGVTTIRIQINHGDHADFVSRPIEIHVTGDGPGSEHDHEEE